mmetsp:Transcript_27521/g.80937  ORF Transcript_27521/g.80937 Transcript_27521/m.80937 type:complete len:264 (-) Transcript_27521:3406-4197(-)|eukprot:CAMPEP_0113576360 /NCGR_PEP_ID=MMETSP0015_2-20120614/28254_1 /TAXON_ID=2838 /ORGANISM="Odontella" /LENGTH=263 /DNA_ID=CAMNT_0000479789 /DNA_START=90 /DNA_END=881 /DNA_ORIENTATION=+ /assembly_acc=CAM_ASM_000160
MHRTLALRAKNLALIGPPGSGKGTYGGILAASIGTKIIATGDILRDHVKRNTPVGQAVSRCQGLGRLADDEIVSEAVLSYLMEYYDGVNSHGSSASGAGRSLVGAERKVGFILDGFPRTARQVEIMETENGWPQHLRAHFAVSIDVPDSICVTKMLGRRLCVECEGHFNVNNVDEKGFRMPPTLPDPPCSCDRSNNWRRRDDDTEEIILKRIDHFHDETNPVIAWYESVGRLMRFLPYDGVGDMPLLESLVTNYLRNEGLRTP